MLMAEIGSPLPPLQTQPRGGIAARLDPGRSDNREQQTIDCDHPFEFGRMKVDVKTGTGLLFICTADGWIGKQPPTKNHLAEFQICSRVYNNTVIDIDIHDHSGLFWCFTRVVTSDHRRPGNVCAQS